MPRLLLLVAGELTRDPRARRAALAAVGARYEVAAVCGSDPRREHGELEKVDLARVGGGRVSRSLRQAGLGGMKPSIGVIREVRGLYRIARLVALNVRLVRAGRKKHRADIIHAHDFDTLLAGRFLQRRLRARLVYDAHELYADQEPDMPRVFRRVVQALEGPLARRADVVITVSDAIADELERSLRLSARPAAVLNCPPRTDVEPAVRGDGLLRAVYQGAMGPGRPLGDLLAAAEAADGVHLTIRVVNADLDGLRRAVAERGLQARVEIAAPVAPDRLVEALADFHVGLLINRPLTRNDELVLPNKLFEYLMAGLAIATPRLPGLTPLVEGHAVGLTCEPGRPDALASVLTRFAREPELLAQMRRRARELAFERFNAEEQYPALAAAWSGR